MAGRGASPRGRTSATRRAPARTPAKKAPARRPAARKPPPPGFGTVIGRAITGFWMLIARGVGWLARAVGRHAASARELDPAHRRDGLALAVLGFAVIAAVAVWFNGAGVVGDLVYQGLRVSIGSMTLAVPLIAAVGAVRMMRVVPEDEHRGRMLVGWTTLVVGLLGLLHLVRGRPATSENWSFAGGAVGRYTAGPLASVVTPWVAFPLLLLVALFGVLVVTATPINTIPAKLGQLRDVALGRHHAPAAAPRRRGRLRRRGAAAAPPPVPPAPGRARRAERGGVARRPAGRAAPHRTGRRAGRPPQGARPHPGADPGRAARAQRHRG